MYTKEEIAKFLKDAVEWLITEDAGCVTLKLDDKLGICVGWLPGYGEEHRDDCIQSKEEPDYAINAGIKVYTSDDMRTDYEFINMPYYENGDVLATDVSIEPDENYEETAEYFLKEYEDMKYLEIEDDGLIVIEDEHEVEVPSGGTEYRELPSDYTHEEESLEEGNSDLEHVAREEYCVIVNDNNESCYDSEEEAIKYARKRFAELGNDSKVKVLLVKYGPKDENGDEVELSVETVWATSFKEDVNESFDDMKSLVNELYDHFEELGAYYEIWPEDNGINIEINWGDWKKDHLWCDYEVDSFLKSKGHEIVSINTDVTDEDGSDVYSAIHSYIIK